MKIHCWHKNKKTAWIVWGGARLPATHRWTRRGAAAVYNFLSGHIRAKWSDIRAQALNFRARNNTILPKPLDCRARTSKKPFFFGPYEYAPPPTLQSVHQGLKVLSIIMQWTSLVLGWGLGYWNNSHYFVLLSRSPLQTVREYNYIG